MIVVQKGNIQYKVDENKKDHFLGLGFNIINEKGKVKEFAPKKKSEQEISLEVEVKNLKVKNSKLSKELKELKAAQVEVKEDKK